MRLACSRRSSVVSVVSLAFVAGCGTDPATPSATSQAMTSLTLEATKTYNPSTFVHDERFLDEPIEFAIPAEIPVVVGNAGNHRTKLRYRLGSGDTVACVYKGGADVAHDDDGVNKDGCAVNAVNNC